MTQKTLGIALAQNLTDVTLEKCASIGLENARQNLPYYSKDILHLKEEMQEVNSAIVIAAGPSLHRNNVAKKILESDYTGALIATESALAYCFRNSLVPDLVVTLDPHPKRIVRFFGDPNLSIEDLETDDYFRRQDLDPEFRQNELKRNSELLELVNKKGPTIKVALASCASQAVVERCMDCGMNSFWWNPIYDDYDNSNSITGKIYELNGLPCLNAGGNVGTASWVIVHSILGIEEVALVGMDLSYYNDTNYLHTQYYYELLDLLGEEHISEAFIPIKNPHLNKTWYTDPTYYWYREIFLEMVAEAPGKTYNCTEGGILFGDNINFIPLQQFLKKH